MLRFSKFSIFVILSKLSRTLLTRFKHRCQSLLRDLFPFRLIINTLCIVLSLASLLQAFRFQQTLDIILSFTISLHLLHFYIVKSRFVVGPYIFLRTFLSNTMSLNSSLLFRFSSFFFL